MSSIEPAVHIPVKPDKETFEEEFDKQKRDCEETLEIDKVLLRFNGKISATYQWILSSASTLVATRWSDCGGSCSQEPLSLIRPPF